MGRACSTNGGDEECLYDIGGKARIKDIIRKKRRNWKDYNIIDLREIGWDRTGSG
jgi:hypothetical protein